MRQKVWVIDDGDFDIAMAPQAIATVPSGKREVTAARENKARADLPAAPTAPKNPAVAFSLSMLMTGCGHLYIGRYRLGMSLVAGKIIFSTALGFILFYWDAIRHLSRANLAALPLIVCVGLAMVPLALLLWLGGAVDAYRRTVEEMPESYAGVDQELLTLLASLFFPGWGHFLNGQPKRGTVYLLFGLTGIFSLFILFTAGPVWSLVAFSPGNFIVELIIIAAILYLPVAGLAWIICLYDIFRARIGETLVSPLPRSSAVLSLLLVVSVGVQLIPEGFYLQLLDAARLEMLNNNMHIIPELTRETMDLFCRLTEVLSLDGALL